MTNFETSILLELQRIAGALECICEHFGAMPKQPPPSSKPRGPRKPKEPTT